MSRAGPGSTRTGSSCGRPSRPIPAGRRSSSVRSRRTRRPPSASGSTSSRRFTSKPSATSPRLATGQRDQHRVGVARTAVTRSHPTRSCSEGGSATDQPTTDQPTETERVMEQRRGERGGQSTTTKTYTVKSGDTLSGIAQSEMGDANRWHELYEANKDAVGDNPDLIHPGLELKIPS